MQSGRTDLKNISRAVEAETIAADNVTQGKHLKNSKAKSVSAIVETKREQILHFHLKRESRVDYFVDADSIEHS